MGCRVKDSNKKYRAYRLQCKAREIEGAIIITVFFQIFTFYCLSFFNISSIIVSSIVYSYRTVSSIIFPIMPKSQYVGLG